MLLKSYKQFIVSTFRQHYGRYAYNRAEFKRTVVSIQVIFVAILASFGFFVIDSWFGLWNHAILDLSMIVMFSASLKLFNTGRYGLGKFMVASYGSIIVLVNGSSQGREAGNHFLFFAIISGMFMLFSVRKERNYLLASLFITLFCLSFLELTDYHFSGFIPFNNQYTTTNYYFSLLVSLFMIAMFSYSYVSTHQSAEYKLEKLNERLRTQNLKLHKTNMELDSFVYKASHDLRSPLTSLLGLIEVMKLEPDTSKLSEYIELQTKMIKKLDSYIQDILNISKNSRVPLDISAINFEGMVNDTLNQLKYAQHYELINKHIYVKQETTFYSDNKRLSIVFNNLISNAIRYCDLSKQFPTLNVSIEVDLREARIEIYDNGIGIGREHINKLFAMFYRATSERTGSGLGLYIVKETVEKLGGRIKLTSELGKWTKFEIFLPNQEQSKRAISNY
ncbi:hypothetical protein SAMN05421780_102198 [Flexibacter flexilis DSM 6793]|uniref:histidine kinase n=1 Tax=Flexibacter flexilis DSM 6793 TaxID=927664 RepID=A0A1I1FHW9_9BACT|nr:HAMP domain-containing sensor histidine kinase [Flexibacter flexilis]SFB98955.1 hypothetical protein SAMN05421780_102198 [Flexibacter flexilis DSM 6793]